MADTKEQQLKNQMLSAVYNLVTAVPTEADRALLPDSAKKGGRFSTANATVHLAVPGIPLDPKDLQDMWTPGNPRGLRSQTLMFSLLVDAIPSAQTSRYVQTAKRVSQAYVALVQGANAEPVGRVDEETLKMCDTADSILYDTAEEENPFTKKKESVREKTAAYKRYEKLLDDIDETTHELLKVARETSKLRDDPAATTAEARDRALRAAEDYWEEASHLPLSKLRHLNEELEGDKKVRYVRQALDFQATHGNVLSERLLANVKDLAKRGDYDDQVLRIPTKLSFPSSTRFATDDSAYGTVTLSTSKLDASLDQSNRVTKLGAGGDWVLWRVGGSGQVEKFEQKTAREKSEMLLEFKVAFVNIIRPWLDATIFSEHVRWSAGRDQDAGTVSSGNIDEQNDSLLLPFIPMQLIVAKDVQLRGDWSSEEKQWLRDSVQASAKVGWGPFSASVSHSQVHEHLEEHDGGATATIRFPGLQVLGVVSWVPPRSAPCAGAAPKPKAPEKVAAPAEDALLSGVVNQIGVKPANELARQLAKDSR